MSFTTRPEITGTFGVVASTHWIASAVGMGLLERGGNAFDAATGMGMTLSVVEPHLYGPLGDMPLLFQKAGEDRPTVLCGQGPAPAGATIDHYRREGLTIVPGSGLLATVIPGAFDAWMTLLRDHGTLSLRDVLEPAIHYAATGAPVLPWAHTQIRNLADFFKTEWPSSAAVWLPNGDVPAVGDMLTNPDLAAAFERLLREAESVSGREAQIDKARDAFYRGFVAEAIDSFIATTEAMDATEVRRKGVLTGEDMAGYAAHYETPVSTQYGAWEVFKTGPWGQGPVLLQALNILNGSGIEDADPGSAQFVHLLTEAMKLAYADREAYYGDPNFSDIPMETLLSEGYAAERRSQMSDTASLEQRAGHIPGLERWVAGAADHVAMVTEGREGAVNPEMVHVSQQLATKKGDTVHLDVIDRWGNMVSATPSGGWLQSNPIVSGLGMALNTRAQIFWLEEGLPNALAPGKRPRTTLTPSLAHHEGKPSMAFGTPGGDQQDQWQLLMFLRYVHSDMNLQQAIDAPMFHTSHFQSSFFPRAVRPGHLLVEPGFGADVIADLERRGHQVEVAGEWSVGRLTAARRLKDGTLKAAATPRLMQAYAIGR